MKNYLMSAILLLLTAAAATGQPMRESGSRPSQRVEQWKKLRMIEMLDLTEEQSIRFFARLNEHEKQKKELMKKKGDALDKIDRLIRIEAADEEFGEVFAEISSVNGNLVQMQNGFFEGLQDILTTEQRGKLLLFERHFDRQLRNAVRELHNRRERMRETESP
ncbi:MAG: hypothetical protein WBG01_13720 [Bacteroidota bacterium]|jgi:hypothetical protein